MLMRSMDMPMTGEKSVVDTQDKVELKETDVSRGESEETEPQINVRSLPSNNSEKRLLNPSILIETSLGDDQQLCPIQR